jgi:hypothetical protein
MTTLKWVLILAMALAAISHLARPSSRMPCCERHRKGRMLDPEFNDIIYCPNRDR